MCFVHICDKKKKPSQILLSADRSEMNEEMSDKKWKIKRKIISLTRSLFVKHAGE